MTIERFSIGIGDRFGQECGAQLAALEQAKAAGVLVVPVWNKSNREHTIIGTEPANARAAADAAVKERGWKDAYYVDADHIGLKTVDRFMAPSNFFTIDVADFIGREAEPAAIQKFVASMAQFKGSFQIPGVAGAIQVDDEMILRVANKYLFAVQEAAKVFRLIAGRKDPGSFVAEMSLDETDQPQIPAELFFILAAVAQEQMPIQTIAPKFTGMFLKGIDYRGDLAVFAKEFEEDLAVIAFAVKTFGLPSNLKLSVHSGSDKFSLYPIMHKAVMKANAGLHLKTAGTTWLEEMIGLASAGEDAVRFVKGVYAEAYNRFDELCAPYATVVSIDRKALPAPAEFDTWSGEKIARTIRHDQADSHFDVNVRQLVHVSFKVAAERRADYLPLLARYRTVVAENVTRNLFDRHIVPLFLGK